VPAFAVLARGQPTGAAGIRFVAPIDEAEEGDVDPASQWWHPAVSAPFNFGGVAWVEPVLVSEPRLCVVRTPADKGGKTLLYWRAK
jgi:uncharacterized membrane-anchored protein